MSCPINSVIGFLIFFLTIKWVIFNLTNLINKEFCNDKIKKDVLFVWAFLRFFDSFQKLKL